MYDTLLEKEPIVEREKELTEGTRWIGVRQEVPSVETPWLRSLRFEHFGDTAETVFIPHILADETFGRPVQREPRRFIMGVDVEERLLAMLKGYENEITSMRAENRRLREEVEKLEQSKVSVFQLPEGFFEEESEEI